MIIKKLQCSILFLFISVVGFGQCPIEPFLYFGSQAAIDAFPVMYPNCTEINGYVFIQDMNITDLSPLSQIVTINGGLNISFTSITNINLTSLSTVGSSDDDFEIRQNLLLESFTGLENLENIRGNYLLLTIQIFKTSVDLKV